MSDFTDYSLELQEKRYWWEGETSPEDMFRRVAKAVAKAEENEELRDKYERAFYNMMINKYFIPNTPCLKNAGSKSGVLSACAVSAELEDSKVSIDDRMHRAAVVMSSGGGMGYNYSPLRPAGAYIHSNGGGSCGPLMFMEGYGFYIGVVIKQSAMRPGAQMGIIDDDHPDVWHDSGIDSLADILDAPAPDFINYKRFYREKLDPSNEESHENILRRLRSFNISMGTTHAFMEAVENDEEWELQFEGKIYRTVNAKEMWDALINSAWHVGDPGLFFKDTANYWSPMNWAYDITATNPCGEQPMPPDGTCNLGHLNLPMFVKNDKFDYTKFKKYVHIGVRFLDDVVTVNPLPFKEMVERNINERRIGLGIADLAGLFLKLGLRYGSPESVELTENIFRTMCHTEYEASIELAKEKGEFPALKDHREDFVGTAFAQERLTESHREAIMEHGIRNCTIGNVAPVGTGSFLIGATGTGIEGVYDWEYVRTDSIGEAYLYPLPMYEEYIEEHGENAKLPDHWTTVYETTIDEQLDIMEVAQRWTDGSISKTFNLPNEATREDVAHIYWQAWKRGLKGVTAFRDGCLASGQVQKRIKPKDERIRPDDLMGVTHRVKFGDDNYYVTITHDERGRLQETFIFSRFEENAAWKNATGRLISLCLRAGMDPIEVAEQLEVIKDDRGQFLPAAQKYIGSEPALIGHILRSRAEANGAIVSEEQPKEIKGIAICPKCKKKTYVLYGDCPRCADIDNCGYSKCG